MMTNSKFWLMLSSIAAGLCFENIQTAVTQGGKFFWLILLLGNIWGVWSRYQEVVNINDLSGHSDQGSGSWSQDQ